MTKKKGLSIGESLRGRMTSLQSEVPEPDANLRKRDLLAETAEGTRTAQQASAVPASPPPTSTADPLESFNTRLRQSTHRRLKVFSAVHNVKIQDVVNEALLTYLDSKEG